MTEDRAISLNAVINVMHEMWGDSGELLDAIKELPSVIPQEPKIGHCEDCKHFRKLPLRTDTVGKCNQHWGVCPSCDWYCADFEPQESEDKE